MDNERRRYFRLPKEAHVTCQEITYPLGESEEFEVYMIDVSEGGVGFRDAPTSLELGSPIQVALMLQGWHRYTASFLKYDETSISKPLTAIGRVVRCQQADDGKFEVGVEFVDIWEDHWNAMRTLLEKERERFEAGAADEG